MRIQRSDEHRRAWAHRLAPLLLLLLGCGRCGTCSPDALATLRETEGPVWRDEAGAVGRWHDARRGDAFSLGDGLKTGAQATAVLELRGGGRIQVAPKTILRFSAGPPGRDAPRIGVETGEVELLGGASGQRFSTELGLALLEPGSRVRIRAGGQRVSLQVQVGRAVLERAGERRELNVSEGVRLEIGSAQLEPLTPRATDAGVERQGPADDAVPLDAGLPDGAVDAGAPDATTVTPSVAELQVLRGTALLTPPGAERPERLRRRDGTTSLTPGARVRAMRGARATVRRSGGTTMLLGAAIQVEADRDVLQQGTVRLEAADGELRLATDGGQVLARPQAQASVRLQRGTAIVRALRGRVVLEGRKRVQLGPGEEARLLADGRVELPERAVDRFHLVVPPGERFTVRIARPPVAVGFRVGTKCEEVATVELMRGRRVTARAHGRDVVGLLVPAGSYRYRVRCGDGRTVAEARLRVVRDAGRAPLPRTPPSTLVDADGRRYVVLYQNLLPELLVRWKDAPESGRYVLHVERQGGGTARTFPAQRPRVTLPSGTLREGRYTVWFEADGRRSARTPVRIGFDNAATVASLRAPKDGAFAPGEDVLVQGVALSGWQVSVGGQEIPLDEQARFEARVSVPPERLGLAIRMAHPSRGVQYYVRRARTKR